MKYLILLCLLSTINYKPCYALESDKAAHLGISYALNTAFYGFNKKALKMDTKNALLFSAFTTLALGFTKEMMDAVERGDERFDSHDFFYDVLGTGLSVGTCLVFEF
jgi:hypothetical protein